MKKRVLACMTALISLSTFIATSCGSTEDSTSKNQELTIWTAPSYVKILQDIDYSQDDEYQNYYAQTVLEVSMFKNEKEGGQIILTPTENVAEYDIEISDLVSSSGAKLSKEATTVFNQKYVDVTLASPSMTVATIGMNPDAFLPFDVAVKYKENKIDGKENQGIYVEYNSKDVEEGVYTGNYTITADGKEYTVPVKVTVWGAEVPSENNLRTSYLLRKAELLQTELDGSDEMFYNYYDSFLDYRINCTDWSYSSLDEFGELLRKYYADERVATVQLPSFTNSAWTAYDYEKLAQNLNFVTELCFEDEVNYYDKAYYYLSMIDEPHITKTEDKVVPIYKNIALTTSEHIAALRENRASYDVSDELFERVITSIENIEWVLTCAYRDDFVYENNKSNPENPDEEYKITWCPYYSSYNTPSGRDQHEQETMREWWYGCDWPGDPYPTFHLDDKILSPRLASWMQYNYNVAGNLYWRVNWSGDISNLGINEPLEDQYDITNNRQKTNGEGFLVYPGKPYGLDTFVPSFRLIAIRDGMEEYEILKATGDRAKEIATAAGYDDYDPNSSFTALYAALYQGTKIIGDDKDFTISREMLAQLATFAAKGTIIANVENKLASTVVTVYTQSGTIKVNGSEPAYTVKEGGKEYVIEVKQDKAENNLVITLEQDGETNEFAMAIGGKKAEINVKNVSYKAVEKNSNTVAFEKTDAGVEVLLGQAPTGVTQQILRMSGDEIKNVLKAGVTSIQIELINPETDAFELEIGYLGDKSPVVYKMATTYTIEPGSTIITINVGTLDWKSIRAITELRFYMTYGEMKERGLTIKSISVTYE